MPGEGVNGWGRSDGWLGQSVYEAERLVRYRPGTILLYRVSVTSPLISTFAESLTHMHGLSPEDSDLRHSSCNHSTYRSSKFG